MPDDHVGRVGAPPADPTLIYDGDCQFCSRWVHRLRRLDRRETITFMARQDARSAELSGRSEAELAGAVCLVRTDGFVFAGAAACREALRYVPGGRIIATMGRIPGVMPASERVYQWIARRWGPVG